MEIRQEEKGNKGAFYVEADGERFAEMTYTVSGPHRIIINHTEVSEKVKGQNIGRKLVAAAVEWARSKDLKILPLCPFAKKVFDQTEEYNDVRF